MLLERDIFDYIQSNFSLTDGIMWLRTTILDAIIALDTLKK
jgi:hypothetical protein